MLGTKADPLGALKFKAHTGYGIPASITISKNNGKWYVSFSYNKSGSETSTESLMDLYGQMSRQDLELISIGLDRGVEVPATDSKGETHGFKDMEILRMERKERRRKKYQRAMARRTKGSGRWKKALHEASKEHRIQGQRSRELRPPDEQEDRRRFIRSDILRGPQHKRDDRKTQAQT